MSRERITITLRKGLIKSLDLQIDGQKLRNRSQAIEYLLAESLENKPPQAIILAGGKQIKFSHLTASEMPKAMLPLNGQPLLEHTIKRLRQFGVKDLIVSVGVGGQKIKDYFRDGKRWDVGIRYLEQNTSLRGTAQALLQAKEMVNDKTFLLLYGDVLTDINYFDLTEFHRLHQGTTCTMMLTSVEHVKQWGVARLAGSRIVEFQEKPRSLNIKSHLVNAGIYALEPEIFNYINDKDAKLELSALPRLAEEGRLGGYVYEGVWCDVSTEQSYREALRLSKG
jgi:NDP-sugar pyrophosphorylase family protein